MHVHACSPCARAGLEAGRVGVHGLEVTVDGGVVRHARIADSFWP